MLSQASSEAAVTTPCIGVCQAPADVCLGCRRTLAEIAAWPRLSEAERRRIMRNLPSRPLPPTR